MKAICLDTRPTSMFLKGKKEINQIIADFQSNGFEIYTTVINVTEFFYGQYKTNNLSDNKINKIKDFFSNLNPREINYEIALNAGKLAGTILKGQEFGWRDLFIAAIVSLNGKKIITNNKSHFSRIPDIEIIEYY